VRVLVVDDDPLHCKLVQFLLAEEGYEVTAVGSPDAALAQVETSPPDLYVLDVNMPQTSGFDLCRKLRTANPSAVILFLTARTELDDRVSGLELGADDYLIKPFEPAELVARVKALMRRYQRTQKATYASSLKAGNVELHTSDLEVVVNGKNGTRLVALTPTEMKLLRCLMAASDRVVSRDVLLGSIWGYGVTAGDGQVIDVYIRRLRKKIEDDPSNPQVIESVRGSGYKFNKSAAA
jgi:DNA-binding response OmpR family regulator